MDWQQISVTLDREDVARAEALLRLCGALALTFDDASDAPIFEPELGTTPLWPSVTIHALLPLHIDRSGVKQMLDSALGAKLRARTRLVSADDWRQGLEQKVAAKSFAPNLSVVPADWHGSLEDSVVVRLNMGLAFGTGQHPTTQLCLEWLAEHPPRGATIYDFGCGSGVLGIAALKLGATQAYATDLDPQALSATQANAQLNAVDAAMWIGIPSELPAIQVDLLIANILAGTLLESAATLAQIVRPGGTLVLSGILLEQRESIQSGYAGTFEQFDCVEFDGWIRMSASRTLTSSIIS